jgi:hypothetical protein
MTKTPIKPPNWCITTGAGRFLILWSALATALSIQTLSQGSFKFRIRRETYESILISPDTHPYTYWVAIALWTAVAIWVGYLGVRGLMFNRDEALEKIKKRKASRKRS